MPPLPRSTVAALLSADKHGIITPPPPQWPTPDGAGAAELPRAWRSADLNRLHRLMLAVPHQKRSDGLWSYRLTAAGQALKSEDLRRRFIGVPDA